MPGTVEKKLADLGIVLPTPAAPVANYVGFVRTGNLLVVSGQLCLDADGKLVATGKLGADVSVEEGQKAARACAINLLAQVKAALGDLDKVVRVVRLGGFISSVPTFLDGPKVMNGASDLMVDGIRRQGPPRPHHDRRLGAAARCRGRGRRHVRGDPDRAMPDSIGSPRGRSPIVACTMPRRGIVENTPSAFAGAIDGQFRHRMRRAALRRRRGHGVPRRYARPADRWRSGAVREHNHGGTEGASRSRHGRPHDDARRSCATWSPAACTLVVEIKSHFDGDTRPADARGGGAVELCRAGRRDVVRSRGWCRALQQSRPGAAARYWSREEPAARGGRDHRGARISARSPAFARPHFLAWSVQDLPAAAPLVGPLRFRPAAADLDRPDRGGAQDRAARYANQMIFEGFRP